MKKNEPNTPTFKLEQMLRGYPMARRLKALYLSHENPIYIWEAYAVCREWKIDIPEWVLKYFDGCSKNLSAISQPGRTSDDVSRALELNKTNFRKWENVQLTIDIGARSQELLGQGKTLVEVRRLLADEFGLAEKTIENHHYEYAKVKDSPLPPHR